MYLLILPIKVVHVHLNAIYCLLCSYKICIPFYFSKYGDKVVWDGDVIFSFFFTGVLTRCLALGECEQI